MADKKTDFDELFGKKEPDRKPKRPQLRRRKKRLRSQDRARLPQKTKIKAASPAERFTFYL